MDSTVADASPLGGYLRVLQITISSLIVAIWALTAAVYPNPPLAILLGLLSVLLLVSATLVWTKSSDATSEEG
jgi:hypothetical protein